MFEDRGDLFIAYSDTSKRMIVLNPSNKHKTLINSQLPTNHFYSNSIVRTGDFVWIFGGYSVPTSDPKSFNHSEFQNHGCSSVKYGAEEDTFTGSAMWHMDKQVWFEGPSLPIKTCSLESTAISLNKTDNYAKKHKIVLDVVELCAKRKARELYIFSKFPPNFLKLELLRKIINKRVFRIIHKLK